MVLRKHVLLSVLLTSTVIIPGLFAQSEREKPKPAQVSAPTHFVLAPNQLNWTAPPEGVIRGTPSVEAGGTLRYAVVEGDPMKPGVPFTIRLGCSDGYKAAPHWHPTDENLVVLSGTFALGMGDKFDPAGLQDMPTGAYGFMPRRMHHFGMCKGETDLLVYGTG
ncbi:MAG: cupin domain-containing protein, partial [Burkholderiales bacterium]